MQGSPAKDPRALRNERPRMVMVSVGIMLFIAGFLVTVVASQHDESASASNGTSSEGNTSGSSPPAGFYIMGGILLSLVGVVLATVGPAAAIVRGKE